MSELGLGLNEGQLRDIRGTAERHVGDMRVTEVVSGAGAEVWTAEEKVSSPA